MRKAAICGVKLNSPNGKYAKYVPSGEFSFAPHLTTFDKKFGHGAIFMSAPHLHHSDKKLGSGARVGCYIREFIEIKEVKEFKEIGSMCYL